MLIVTILSWKNEKKNSLTHKKMKINKVPTNENQSNSEFYKNSMLVQIISLAYICESNYKK